VLTTNDNRTIAAQAINVRLIQVCAAQMTDAIRQTNEQIDEQTDIAVA